MVAVERAIPEPPGRGTPAALIAGRLGLRSLPGYPPPVRSAVSWTVVVATLLLAVAPAAAHDFTVTDVRLVLDAGGGYRVEMACDLDALALGASPNRDSAELAAALAAMDPGELAARVEDLRQLFGRRVRIRFDGEPALPEVSFPDLGAPPVVDAPPSVLGTRAVLSGRVPPGAGTVSFAASRAFPPVRLVVEYPGGATSALVLESGERSPPQALTAPAPPARPAVAWRYLRLGFVHILPRGLDHVLFVLGLFLLAPRWRPLLWQVSAFTVAHTVSLALSSFGVVSLPSQPVEILIALSIVYVAVENALTAELHPWRPAVVFLFGLLHGLGFAGVLGELGLPPAQAVTALAAFNVGVEAGQLAVLAGAFLLLGTFRARPWYRRRLAIPLSAAIAAVGLWWAVERAGGL